MLYDCYEKQKQLKKQIELLRRDLMQAIHDHTHNMENEPIAANKGLEKLAILFLENTFIDLHSILSIVSED